MKKIIYLFLSISIFGCTDLEEEVFSELSPSNFYNSVDDADSAVIAIYNSMNRAVNLWDFGMLSLTFMPAPHTNSRVPWREQWANYTTTAADGISLPRVFNSCYQAIFRANIAITELEARTFENPAEDAVKEELIAEAKWLRAFNYFNLVRLFGAVPMPLEATNSIEGSKLPRSPISEVYSQIILDLKAAEANLPDTKRGQDKIGRPVVGTAKFLLGKVYLTMAGKPLSDTSKMALAHAKIKELIDNKDKWGYELLSSYEDAIRIEQNNEVIFAIQQSQAVADQGTALSFVWGGPSWPYGNGGQYHGGFSREFYESYEEDDVRRDVTMAFTYVGNNGDTLIYGTDGLDTNGDGKFTSYDLNEVNGIAPNKYQDADQGCCDGDPDILLYRYSDALLMFAEAENEINGPTFVAYDFLNQVRLRAGASAYDPNAGLSKDEFRELMYKERFWELSFEFHEVYDIRRFGKVEEAISQNPEAQRIGTTYDSKFELWPLPLSEIQTNPNLQQTTGW